MDAVERGVNMNSVDLAITKLVAYALKTNLIECIDINYSINSVLDVMKYDSTEVTRTDVEEEAGRILSEDIATGMYIHDVLENLVADAVERGICDDGIASRDLFDTKLMGVLMPRPSEVNKAFWNLYKESPVKATEFYYDFSGNSNYIRRERIAKDVRWTTETEYGLIDLSINLSKPEKDPKAIAAAAKSSAKAYPKCMLCAQSEGYAGRLDYPARENHRIISIEINDNPWGLQYSPYVYYNEHCIVFNQEHVPMKIDQAVFTKLFDFVRQFPHYFVGSNADLPIVGGSILSHEHFQGGNYTFAIERAETKYEFTVPGFEDIKTEVINWPMSVIRISSEDYNRLAVLANRILEKWRSYDDESVMIYSYKDGEPHSTVTPIARMRNGKYELDLVLRNNLTSEEHPLGIFHPHENLHHIKKENIGLIEVMGLAVLPARLKNEMDILKDALLEGRDIASDQRIAHHAAWAEEFSSRQTINESNADDIIKEEIGRVYVQVLKDAGVFKDDEQGFEAFKRFVNTI